jgi:hypothetical protein
MHAQSALHRHVFGPLESLETDPNKASEILPAIAKAFNALNRLMPQAASVLETLKPGIVLDVAASEEPGAMALLGTLGLFPTYVGEDGDDLLRAAVARATPAQRADLMRLMVGIIRIH